MGTPTPAAHQKMSWDAGDFYAASFGVGKSRRYHSAMRDFYRRCADLITSVTALSGTSAFVALFLNDPASLTAKVLTGCIAAASTLELVFGFAKKADLHESLSRRFTLLAADMVSWPADEEHLQKARALRLIIEADEPPVRRVIDCRAFNDEARARGCPASDLMPLGFFQRSTPLGYWLDFGLPGIEKRWRRG